MGAGGPVGLQGPVWKAPIPPPAHPSTRHAAGPGCRHHAAPAMDFWLRPVLINIFNYKMDALTGSARRARQREDGASAGAAAALWEEEEEEGGWRPAGNKRCPRGAGAEGEPNPCGNPEQKPCGAKGWKPAVEKASLHPPHPRFPAAAACPWHRKRAQLVLPSRVLGHHIDV